MNRIMLALVLVFLVSCKQEKTSEEDQTNTPITFGTPLMPQRVLEGNELTIAKRLCWSLREVGINYESFGDKELMYRYKTSQQKCGTSGYTSIGDYDVYFRKNVQGEIYLEPMVRSTRILEDIPTDRQGLMADLCDDINANREAQNIYEISGSKYNYRPLSVGGFDSIEIARYTRDSDGVYYPRSIEAYSIYTVVSTNSANNYGLVKDRVQALPCNGKTGIQSFRQEFISVRRTR